MAKHKQGILGSFSGTVGSVVGSTYKGQGVMKVRPAGVRNPNTPAQLQQRQRFALVMSFLRHARPIVDLGYQKVTQVTTPMNEASRYNLKNGLTGSYPTTELNFPELMVCRGTLSGVRGATLNMSDAQTLQVQWTDNSGRGSALPGDQLMLMLYNEAQQEALFSLLEYSRADGSLEIQLPDDYLGENVHVWLGFRSLDGSASSDSTYAGLVTLE